MIDINESIYLQNIVEKNKELPWNEWLEFDQSFDNAGKQGLVGLFKVKGTNKKIIFKISQYINYLATHEFSVMTGLKDLSPYCIHFCKSLGIIQCNVDPSVRKEGNPFNIKSIYPIEKKILLCEYINKSTKMYNLIRAKDKINENIIYSTVKQVLLAIIIAQKHKKFTHYDLHSNNIMMKKCNKDTVFVYALDEGNQFCVPTNGYYPIIIDYGFSYIDDMQDKSLWASLAHTDVGFMSDRYDWVADPKLFLVTVSSELKKKRNSHKSKKFRRVVKNMFCSLDIDWEAGWDDEKDKGAADYVMDMLKSYNKHSNLFEDYDHYCIDILQSLIILPLEEQDYSNIHNIYKIFLKEWVKIECEISSPFYNLYILKNVIDAARKVRASYYTPSMRKDSVLDFREDILTCTKKISKWCNPKNVNYEQMLCSLLILAKNIEGILYDVIKSRMQVKKKEYDKLPLQSTDHIYAAIEANIPCEYIFNKNSKIVIMDAHKKGCFTYNLTENDISVINKIHPMIRGTYIYDLYNKVKK